VVKDHKNSHSNPTFSIKFNLFSKNSAKHKLTENQNTNFRISYIRKNFRTRYQNTRKNKFKTRLSNQN